jgi:hypothetical protein
MKKVLSTTAGIVVAVTLSAAILVGLFFLGWWIKEYAVNRNAEIRQDSYGRQNALVEQILDDIAEAEGNIPPNQRAAIIDGICDSEAKLTGSIELPPSAQQFIRENCS